MKHTVDHNGEVLLHRAPPPKRAHTALFYGCVGVSVVVVIAAWVVVIRGVISQGVDGAKTMFSGATETFSVMKEATAPAREQVTQAGDGIREVIADAFEGARERQEAVNVVADIVKAELAQEESSVDVETEAQPVPEETYVEETTETVEPAI